MTLKKNKQGGKHKYKWSLHCSECFKKFMEREWKKVGGFNHEN